MTAAAQKYRVDHVGSLLRPPELLAARDAYPQGRITLEQLRAVENRAILKALDLQREVGLDIFTDGEYQRGIWYGPLHEAIEGLIPDPSPPAAPPPASHRVRSGSGSGA